MGGIVAQQKRLARLELPLHARWSAQWSTFRQLLAQHYTGLARDELETFPDAELEQYRLARGYPSTTALKVWFSAAYAAMPEPGDFANGSDLWPAQIPTPPEEPLALWQRLEPLLLSTDRRAVAYAQLTLCMLATARAVRAYQSADS
jgi:hypothetical protein